MIGAGIQRIVGIHGAPRSGTTWLGQLFNASEHVAYRYQPMFSYAFRDRLHTDSDAEEISTFFADLLRTTDDFVLQKGDASLAGYELSFPKREISHLVYKEVRYHDLIPRLLAVDPDFAAIGIVRDPRAVIQSWSVAPREFDGSWELAREWRDARRKNLGRGENWYGFERWKELTLLFHRLCEEYPERFAIVRYEDLAADAVGALSSMFAMLDLPWTQQVRDFARESHSRDDGSAYGVFRRPATMEGEWHGRLDAAIANEIVEELQSGPLQRYLCGADSR